MKPLPGGCYTACDYKAVLKVPNNYHIEYDGHYYSVLYVIQDLLYFRVLNSFVLLIHKGAS